MKRSLFLGVGIGVASLLMAAPVVSRMLRPPVRPGWSKTERRFTLPNGWRLTPAGRAMVLPGDMPGTILVLDSGRAIVNTCGFHDHTLNLIDVERGKVLDTLPFDRNWIGMARTREGRVLVSGGRADEKNEAIHEVGVEASRLTRGSGFSLPGTAVKGQFVSALLIGPEGTYVVDIQHDEVVLLGNDGNAKARAKVGYRPYGAALSPSGDTFAVSNWGDKSVSLLDSRTLASRGKISVQALPCALVYAPDGRLFVTNSGSNTVSVLEGSRVTETIRTGIDRANRIGSTPVALVLSPDAHTLYVATADNNCITVIDISRRGRSRVRGLIPTERYPSAIAITPDGRRLIVGTAKGFYGPNAGSTVSLEGLRTRGTDAGPSFQYIGEQLSGRLAIIDVPNDKQLAAYTKQTIQNAPLGLAAGLPAEERTRIEREAFSRIKHVIYVIKENRTYDQELGDLGKGNGDPSLIIFGRKVTPNTHKIASEFVLFDNLYTDGETSQVGHQWTDAAYANDYEEKQWALNYSGRGEIESDRRLTSSPGEYLWTQARKKGLWARVYGEYVDVQEDHGSLKDPEMKRDPEKFGYSESFERIFGRNGRDVEKVDDFLREMREAEKTGKWPSLMVMALPEDHTVGFRAGAFSPQAMVADNDYAVGKLIDAVSRSVFWKSTVIFTIQDDAQDGPDHVDSHRTVALVASPYAKRGVIDSTMYSTASMLRTMELILRLPPMSQYDAKATPMHAAFTTLPNFEPYRLASPLVDLNERNPSKTALARRSEKLDWSDIDRADWGELNRLLWAGYRPGVPYPAPVHGR